MDQTTTTTISVAYPKSVESLELRIRDQQYKLDEMLRTGTRYQFITQETVTLLDSKVELALRFLEERDEKIAGLNAKIDKQDAKIDKQDAKIDKLTSLLESLIASTAISITTNQPAITE
jgi:uncharacterized coiled-coil protein SlyX